MPKLYDGYFNDQIAKQASTAVSKAIAAGKVSCCCSVMLIMA